MSLMLGMKRRGELFGEGYEELLERLISWHLDIFEELTEREHRRRQRVRRRY